MTLYEGRPESNEGRKEKEIAEYIINILRG